MVYFSPRQDAASLSEQRKKSVASLLPAFEPFSSSPALPKSLKRTRDVFEERNHLPTPVPTSSTHILSSSPPAKPTTRPGSGHSERVPLGALPTVTVRADGRPTKLGRSSQTCDFQLSANRLISRVHVEVTYHPSNNRLRRERIEILCTGWNGVKIHYQSKVYDLRRGSAFSCNSRASEVILDIHDSRVILQWPEKAHLGLVSSDEEELNSSPVKRLKPMQRHSTPPSPSPAHARKARPSSPASPTPAAQALLPSSPPIPSIESHPRVDIFEDPEPNIIHASDDAEKENTNTQSTLAKKTAQDQTFTTQASDLDDTQSFSDNDEENDPLVHSFGPFGANILPRMAAFTAADTPRAASPQKSAKDVHSEPLRPISSPSQPQQKKIEIDVQSHVINQLAFSRLSSLPLSTILSHLPLDAQDITSDALADLIRETRCIGEVVRAGKDAAGKILENEFYYIPDQDDDLVRQQAVVSDLRKPSLRACRKQHKQYYWKKPK